MTHTVPTLPLPDFTHERVEVITGRRSGLFLTVALHSSVLGSALGGARLWTYPHWSDALGDALRLSAAMTLKNAAAGLDAGGGKSVIALPPGVTLDADRRRAAFLDLGDAVESLHGLYRTAEDVGSTTDDMLVVSERTEHVVGLPDAVGGSGEPAGPTSLGVYESLRATLERVTGTADVAGRRITVSGLGQVGSRLAVRLSAEGAHLTVTDVNPAKRDLATELGADWIAPGEEHLVPADVFVPAGIGGLLTDEVIDALDAKAVCGPANNPLADHSGAERLAGRGILYAPDFVVNAGGVIYLDLEAKRLGTRTEIMDRVAQIGDTVRRIFDEAESRGVTPLEAAEGLAAERLAAGGRQPALAV
ncbi:Glu/Leu/Phe/Val dehydrogenase dimerization domain-containing protein [Microbacterium sp. M3]|uniref:Glu/Leu/Phe/Val dehydrogenase dimerization domain-containing protein n=1 Tax=Microbacterium arthrosphaerae TaxID=792652 RepID=A0ABU4GWC4_9MICO|nr:MULTISPECIES: Glu/Leu/Phe/Val dehydrogenase dimerization domain-containing protein [Microbacterium]MDW4571368.1 Glu/Leu/Phe/Val dehydrogenase dimerization domain-containing protein [Microbacterium arthrosphaerae]MDW7605223.1 Glu/Leu/Phe/Val dehydrogenase dimerization domain-containing protein [Microbacterium sp. M3]